MVPIKHWNRKTSVKHTAFAQIQRAILLIKVIIKPLKKIFATPHKIRIILLQCRTSITQFHGSQCTRQKFDFKGFRNL